MAKMTKRAKAIAEKIETGKQYGATEAFDLLKDISSVKFSEAVDVSVNLGIDPRKSDQVVRGSTVLPNGTGKTVRVAVFAQGANADAAKEAGADIVGMDDLAATIKGGDLNFDVVIASPDAMGVVGQLGQILGPRGLMPNPKTGTVCAPEKVGEVVAEVKAGRIDFRVDRAGIVHSPVGKVSMEADKIRDNILALIGMLIRLKPSSAKGTYMKTISVSSTMGPGIRLDANELSRTAQTR